MFVNISNAVMPISLRRYCIVLPVPTQLIWFSALNSEAIFGNAVVTDRYKLINRHLYIFETKKKKEAMIAYRWFDLGLQVVR